MRFLTLDALQGISNNTKILCVPCVSFASFAVKKRLNRKGRKELRKVRKESIRCAFGTKQYKNLIF